MGARDDALRHLGQAQEFLLAAEGALDDGLLNAATSLAVIAGINAKDTICLVEAGVSRTSENHLAEVPELAAAGPVGRATSSTFCRLLGLKSRSRYEATPISGATAVKSVEWASRMVGAARDVTGR